MSPEGLDSFLTRLAGGAVKTLDDRARVRLLQVWGIEALVVERPLAADVTGARLLAKAEGPLAPVYVYAVDDPTPFVRRVAGARSAADPRAARDALLDPTFDPRVEVVLAGGSSAPPGAGGVSVELERDERIVVSTNDARPGYVVVERTWQPLWKARVDERDASVVPADLHRLAVAVPAGAHDVELWVDRSPLWRAAAATLAGLVGLMALALRARTTATLPPP
jgi:hypothetical protein